MLAAHIQKDALAPLQVLHAPSLRLLTSIKRETLFQLLRGLGKNSMANNGGDFAQKKVVQKNLNEEVIAHGT